MGKAIRTQFLDYFPNPDDKKKDKGEKTENPYKAIINWFGEGSSIDLLNDLSNQAYEKALLSVPGLADLVKNKYPKKSKEEQLFLMEFVLHGLAEYSKLSKSALDTGTRFKDLLSSMFSIDDMEGFDEDELS